jgi:hypothetical protein
MAGKHHANGNVTYTKRAYDSGTQQVITYKSLVLRKKRLQPVASMALGAVVSIGITLALWGVDVGQPSEEPVPVAITPASVTSVPVAEPPLLSPPASVVQPAPTAPPWPHRAAVLTARPLPTRIYPTLLPTVEPPKHGGKHRKSNDKDHDGDSK